MTIHIIQQTNSLVQAAQGARRTRLRSRGFGPHRLRCGLGRLGWWSDAALGTMHLRILLELGGTTIQALVFQNHKPCLKGWLSTTQPQNLVKMI